MSLFVYLVEAKQGPSNLTRIVRVRNVPLLDVCAKIKLRFLYTSFFQYEPFTELIHRVSVLRESSEPPASRGRIFCSGIHSANL